MYYLTVYNEPMLQPAEPEDVDIDGIVRGIHQVARAGEGPQGPAPRLRGIRSLGARRRRAARAGLGRAADVWSVTSWTELRRDGLAAEEHNFLHPEESGGCRTSPETRRAHRDRWSPPPTTPPRSPTRSVSSCPALRHTRGRRSRLLRHPRRSPAVVPHRRPLRRGTGAPAARSEGQVDRSAPRRRRSATGCSTCRRHHRQRRRGLLQVAANFVSDAGAILDATCNDNPSRAGTAAVLIHLERGVAFVDQLLGGTTPTLSTSFARTRPRSSLTVSQVRRTPSSAHLRR